MSDPTAIMKWLPMLMASIAVWQSASAHHSRAGFDLGNETRLSGTVTELNWANPHIYMRVDLDNGENWLFEGHSVPGAQGLGWTRDTVRAGDEISIGANISLDPDQKFSLMNWIVTRDGVAQRAMPGGQIPEDVLQDRVASAGQGGPGAAQGPGAPGGLAGMGGQGGMGAPGGGRPGADRTPGNPNAQPSTDMSGNWAADLRGRNLATGVFDPARNLPLTVAGQAVLDAYRDEDNPAYQCLPGSNFAGAMNGPYDNRIERFDNRMEITKESHTNVYTIWLGEENAPGNHVPDRTGLTIGHFDDERTLVWQTTGFAPSRWGISRGVDSSDQKVVDGRFELAEDGMRLNVTIVTTDPVYLTEPLSRSFTVHKNTDREFDPVPCDPAASSRHITLE